MIADQMKKKCSPECKEHYLDIWEELISPEMLADKLEAFDNIRRSLPSGPRRYVKASEIVNDGRQVSFRKPERPPKREYSHQVPNERSPLRCYGCGKQRVKKYTCPICNPQRLTKNRRSNQSHQCLHSSDQKPSIDPNRHSLADGQQTIGEALTTQVMVEIEGRSVLTKFIILPKAKGNRTLLGTDFLSSAGLVLNVKNTCWYFWDNPTHKYPFCEELDTPSIVEKMSCNTCQLREGEGERGEATNILEHHINTGNSSPISVPPYRMSPVKNCPDCIKYKASNQKPSGLLQTPVPAQRFETWPLISSGPYLRVKMNDNFVPEINPYLKKFAKFSTQIREVVEEQQDSRKFYADKKRKAAPTYQPGEHVFVASHSLSNAAQGRSAKLMPRKDGPYVILTQSSLSLSLTIILRDC
ncbi:CCHC-type domain-containing protein [Trichonephila clavipes]|nr:CCHC-type domain-containing protein [Trichonephila clavipes]